VGKYREAFRLVAGDRNKRTAGKPTVATVRFWPGADGRERLLRRCGAEKKSIRALERSLCGIKLTFTWQGSLKPQQPISIAVPQRAISVTVPNRKWSRV
jgi:hypothetical protein